RGQGVPFVLINGYSERVRGAFVSPDDRAAMRLAVTHLRELGHQRIGLALGPRRFVPVQRKIEGFREAIRSGGPSTTAQDASPTDGPGAGTGIGAGGHTARRSTGPQPPETADPAAASPAAESQGAAAASSTELIEHSL